MYLTDKEVKANVGVMPLVVEAADKFTVPLYLLIEYSLIVEVWGVPAKTVNQEGEMDMLKFGVGTVEAGLGDGLVDAAA